MTLMTSVEIVKQTYKYLLSDSKKIVKQYSVDSKLYLDYFEILYKFVET